MTERLSDATFHAVDRPSAIGILHLGPGNFHRAHQAVFTEDAGSWGICGATQRSPEVADRLRPQDCLYTVLERSRTAVACRVVGSLREVLFARAEPDRLWARFIDPAVRIVSITVSEKGYRRNALGRLDLTDPLVQRDISGIRAPQTTIGQLVRGLQRRRATSGAPVTVLSCDNLVANGATTRTLALDFCAALPRAEGRPLASWITRNARFPNTVADRIVPAATAEDRATVEAMLGLTDAAVVVAEPHRQWVIENDFAAGRPAWEKSGVRFTPDITPYETMKLRLLNGTHSLLAYLGALAGHETISAAAADPALNQAAVGFMEQDALPTVPTAEGIDAAAYAAEVLTRLSNPALPDRTTRVAMDGSQKLPLRLLNTIRERLAAGATPHWATRAVAAWMVYVAVGRDRDGRPLPLEDPLAAKLRHVIPTHPEAGAIVNGLLSIPEIFGADLPDHGDFRRSLTEQVEELLRGL